MGRSGGKLRGKQKGSSKPAAAAAKSAPAPTAKPVGPTEAIVRLQEAVKADPKNVAAWNDLGALLRETGRAAEAVTAHRSALALRPDALPLAENLALSLIAAGRAAEARILLGRFANQGARSPGLWMAFSAAYSADGSHDAALACARRAAALDPRNPQPLLACATLLSDKGEHAAADAAFAGLLKAVKPTAPLLARRVQSLINLKRLDEAQALAEQAIALDPASLDAQLAMTRLRMTRGEWPDAWAGFEIRWGKGGALKPKLSGTEWDGRPFADKTLLVYCESDSRDAIQFARYLRPVIAMGGRVILRCPPNLARLFESVGGLAGISVDGAPPPAFDLHVPLLSLPRLLRATPQSPSAPLPYLDARDTAFTLPPREPGSLRVGICWAGEGKGDEAKANADARSLPLSEMLRLVRFPELRLFSLQTGDAAAELEPYRELVAELGPSCDDMAAMAAAIKQLDLVITADTTVAHLAGALGRPVWVVLPYQSDWRWGVEGEATAWYPTMRLFRQAQPKHWTSLFAALETAAEGAIAERKNRRLVVPSVFRDGERPRFVMPIPEAYLADAGVGYLYRHETQYGGYEYNVRLLIDSHLKPGDLFLDIGAHWGIMALQAATRWPDVRVLAIEASARNHRHLTEWIAANNLGPRIETVHGGASDKPGKGALQPQSTMGHHVERLGAQGGRGIEVMDLVTVDGLLADRPHLSGTRVFIKIDVEGLEPEVLAGAAELLDSGRVRAIVWERGHAFDQPERRDALLATMERLTKLGFRHYRFPHEEMGGPLVPFVFGPDNHNIVSLAADEPELPTYVKPPSPVVPFSQSRRARSTPDELAAFTEALIAARATDGGLWNQWDRLAAGAGERAAAAAPHLAGAASVLDLGAGRMALRRLMPAGTAYTAVDLVQWPGLDHALDLNAGQFPDGHWDAAALLSVLQFVHDPAGLLARLRASAGLLVLSYPIGGERLARRAAGMFNDFDEAGLTALLVEAGWTVGGRAEAAGELMLIAQ